MKPKANGHSLPRYRSKKGYKPKTGRPPKFKEEYLAIAHNLCQAGATDQDLAEAFGVWVCTIYTWRANYPEFAVACRLGKEAADDRVERSMYHRAIGYSHRAQKITYDKDRGKWVRTNYVEHYPPDTAAGMFWLTNRRGDDWKHKQELTGKDGGPVEHRYSVTEELRAKLDQLQVPDHIKTH